MKMTKECWEQIQQCAINGDPLKDVGFDEEAMLEYIYELRKRLKLKRGEP